MLLEYKKDHEVRRARLRSWNASSNVQACPQERNPVEQGAPIPIQPQWVNQGSARCLKMPRDRSIALKATETPARYSFNMAIPLPARPTGNVPRRARAATYAGAMAALRKNVLVSRHLCVPEDMQSPMRTLRHPVAAGSLLLGIVATVLPLPSRTTIAALLTVGIIGIAAGKIAAATGLQRRPSVRRSPANDNVFRLVLPPPPLRC